MASGDVIQIGRATIGLETAEGWVRAYTDERNRRTTAPYAYPAYDEYMRESNDPLRPTDADLLAPGLLNVTISLRSFYALQEIREDLEAGLAKVDPTRGLAELEDDEVRGVMAGLYGVLDDERKPSGVGGTKLSKVLHRKAPHSLVLRDGQVHECYVGPGRPVYPARKRSWVDYMSELSLAMGRNIREQPGQFERLRAAAGGRLTDVRVLDILAWWSRGRDF